MALRNIVKQGDDILLKKARTIEKFDDKLKELVQDMKDTLEEVGGLGLAGPQVGILRRVFIARPYLDDNLVAFINPEIVPMDDEMEEDVEACLSCGDLHCFIDRYKTITVKAQDENGDFCEMELLDYPARVIQHENDHLDGVLITERANKMMNGEEYREWVEEQEALLEEEGETKQ